MTKRVQLIWSLYPRVDNSHMLFDFPCRSCNIKFGGLRDQREHYKTNWHRYNIKRKVEHLPPVTRKQFKILVREKKQEIAAQTEKDTPIYCKPCRKAFNSPKSFANHLNSKKHIKLMADFEAQENIDETHSSSTENDASANETNSPTIDQVSGDESDIEEVDSDEWDEDVNDNNPILRNDCLFCSHHSATMTKNVKHMSLAHSFFIPDIEYLINMKGLLLYLGEKISSGFMCLWCNEGGKAFRSLEAARQHMVDKGHCKMIHEGVALLEYSDYYDYRKSYPDYEQEKKFEEEFEGVEIPIIEDNDYQLVLPSGAVIGHRSLMRYYRQNFDPNKVVVPAHERIKSVISKYKALGWKETEQQAIQKKRNDLKFMHHVWSKNNMKIGVKANNLSIKRPQINY